MRPRPNFSPSFTKPVSDRHRLGVVSTMDNHVADPPVVSRDEWLKQRKDLLQEEKAHTRAYDALNAKRRRLPMVKVEKSYVFQTNQGPKTLLELF
ncbi:DUF899 family protein, partial [Acinetobacter baumannii]